MTIKQITINYSKKLKSSSPILDIELLLTKILNKPKEYLYTYPDQKLTQPQLTKFKQLFKRRIKGEPIAYILGYQEFFNLKFIVNKNVLIPRPETEILVEQVIKYYKALSPKLKAQCQLADIGVGSGAIIIALAKNLNFSHTACPPKLQRGRKPVERIDKNAQIQFYSTDISSKVISVAEQNAKTHKIKIEFFKGNLLEPLIKIQNSEFKIQNSIITANLPYLDKKELKNPTIKKEPKLALDGGADGLKYYREFFEQISEYKLKPQAIFLEIGHSQTLQIKKLAKQALPKYKLKSKKDLCGFDRLVIITNKFV